MISVFRALILLSGLLCSFPSFSQKIAEPHDNPADWSKAYPPFRIAGNLYYVGTYDLACYLVATTQGHILINTGLAASVPLIKSSVEALGFQFKDIKILLTMQAHFDHVGAMAAIKKMTGAALLVDEQDAAVMSDGGKSDYAFGGAESLFEPVRPDRLLHDGDTIQLGDARLVMLHHPGHTKGSCSFMLQIRDEKKSYTVLLANLPTIVVEKRFPEVAAYPEIEKDYAATFASLKNMEFDLWLCAHASQCSLHTKHQPGDTYNPEAFIDPKGYKEAVSKLEAKFNEKAKGN